MNKYKTTAIFLATVILLTICMPVFAGAISTFAHSTIGAASVSLASNKKVGFSVAAISSCTIKVTSCYVQKQNSNGTWSKVGDVEKPSSVTGLTMNASSDASSLIGSGTYRVICVYSANGETTTCTSSTRTF